MGTLNDVTCKTAKAVGKDSFLGDGGGLFLRVRPGENTKKVWLYRFKSLTGSGSRWFEIGTYPELSLLKARLKAVELAVKRRAGIDPIAEAKAADIAAAESEAATKAAKTGAAAKVAARLTVGALLDRWQDDYLSHKRKDCGMEVRRSFVKDVLPALGAVPAEDVGRGSAAIRWTCSQNKRLRDENDDQRNGEPIPLLEAPKGLRAGLRN